MSALNDPKVYLEAGNPQAKIHLYHTPCSFVKRCLGTLKGDYEQKRLSECAGHEWCELEPCRDGEERYGTP